MREEYDHYKNIPPNFTPNYKLGECKVQDCGCIIEFKGKNDAIVWCCAEHT